MKTKQILTAGAIALSMILTGCSSTSTDTKDTKTTEVAKKKEVKTIGQKSKDSKSLKMTNNTGKKITVFETKSSSEENFSDNLLENGDAVKNKEERILYYEVKENDKLDVKVELQDQDKTFVFKDVDTVDIKKVDVSLKDDKVNLDVTKKDGSTATLTPSEDSAKTEDEKKDESEVKQEEKKKAEEEEKQREAERQQQQQQSAQQSQAPSTNTNNSGSNSSNSKPAEHTHNWVAQYKTVNVPEKGHNEQVLVQAAYDEQVPQYQDLERSICNQCGADITNNIDAHFKSSWDCYGYHMEFQQVLTGYKTVHHEAVYETRYVVDSPATTKQELTGYKCSGCGKTKAN